MGPKEVKIVGAGRRERAAPPGGASQRLRRHTCRFFPLFNMPITCLCLFFAKPEPEAAIQRGMGLTAFGQFPEERQSRRVRNDSNQAKDWHRMLSLSLLLLFP